MKQQRRIFSIINMIRPQMISGRRINEINEAPSPWSNLAEIVFMYEYELIPYPLISFVSIAIYIMPFRFLKAYIYTKVYIILSLMLCFCYVVE